jgi:hypothetical protein
MAATNDALDVFGLIAPHQGLSTSLRAGIHSTTGNEAPAQLGGITVSFNSAPSFRGARLARTRNPGCGACGKAVWIPGSPLARRPGMTVRLVPAIASRSGCADQPMQGGEPNSRWVSKFPQGATAKWALAPWHQSRNGDKCPPPYGQRICSGPPIKKIRTAAREVASMRWHVGLFLCGVRIASQPATAHHSEAMFDRHWTRHDTCGHGSGHARGDQPRRSRFW